MNIKTEKNKSFFDEIVTEWQRFCQSHYLPDNYIVETGRSIAKIRKAVKLRLIER